MCLASRSTTRQPGLRHPDKITFRSKPSGVTERIRPKLASRKNNRPSVSFVDVRFSFEIWVSLILFISTAWVSYLFLKLSKTEISENERSISKTGVLSGLRRRERLVRQSVPVQSARRSGGSPLSAPQAGGSRAQRSATMLSTQWTGYLSSADAVFREYLCSPSSTSGPGLDRIDGTRFAHGSHILTTSLSRRERHTNRKVASARLVSGLRELRAVLRNKIATFRGSRGRGRPRRVGLLSDIASARRLTAQVLSLRAEANRDRAEIHGR